MVNCTFLPLQLSRLCQVTITHNNMLMYRALLNFLYSLEKQTLVFSCYM